MAEAFGVAGHARPVPHGRPVERVIPDLTTLWGFPCCVRFPCQYFGVIFNYRSLRVFKECVVRYWRKALGKRSQKGRMNWTTYRQLLIAFPLPEPAIHQAWLR